MLLLRALLVGICVLWPLSICMAARPDRLAITVYFEDVDPSSVPRSHAVTSAFIKGLYLGGPWAGPDSRNTAPKGQATESGRLRIDDGQLMADFNVPSCDICRAELVGLAVLQLYVDAQPVPGSHKWIATARLTGRALDYSRNRKIADFEVSDIKLAELPDDCHKNRACVLEHARRHAATIASEAAGTVDKAFAALRPRLQTGGHDSPEGCLSAARQLFVGAQGFTTEELAKLESILTAHRCYSPILPIRRHNSDDGDASYTYWIAEETRTLAETVRTSLDGMGISVDTRRSVQRGSLYIAKRGYSSTKSH